MPLIITFVGVLGFALLIPGLTSQRERWLGFRFCISLTLVPISIFFGNILFGIPISVVTWLFLTTGFVAIANATIRGHLFDYKSLSHLTHPILVLPALLFTLVIITGDTIYLPYPGDETGSWLRLARQIFLADHYWSNDIIYQHPAYTNGWPLMVAFSSVVSGEFAELNAVVLLFFLHVGILGFTYDFTRFVAVRSGFNDERLISGIAWNLILFLLAVEASWKLLPTNLLIEKPLLYAYISGFILVFASQYEEISKNRISSFIGIICAFGYLMKVSFVLFFSVLFILLMTFIILEKTKQQNIGIELDQLWPNIRRKALIWGGLIFAPTLCVAAIWSLRKVGSECFAAPWLYLADPELLLSDKSWRIAEVIYKNVVDYVGHYKWQLSLFGTLVCSIGLFWSRSWLIVVTLVVFTLAFIPAMHLAYFYCFSPFTESGLQGFQRYLRPILRFIHFIPFLIIICFLLETIGRNSLVLMNVQRVWTSAILLVVGVFLFLYQGVEVRNSMADISTRKFQDPLIRDSIIKMKLESIRLEDVIKQKKLVNPRVSIIDQGHYSVNFDLAQYFGIKSRRNGSYFKYTPLAPYSWGETQTNRFMRATSTPDLVKWWKTFDIIWPLKTDPWTRSALKLLITEASCAEEPENYFLSKSSKDQFDCIKKRSEAE